MKKTAIFVLWTFLLSVPSIASSEVTQNDRLFQRPERDGAVVQKYWLDTAVTFQQWDFGRDDAEVWTFGPTFITSLPSNRSIELGGRVDLMNFDPDGYGDESGLSDIDLWGKYQFLTGKDYLVSAGLLLTLPTGSEKIIHPRASGEVNVEMFAAGRYQVKPSLAAIAHVALRRNADMDIEVRNVKAEVDGELQMALGGGVIYEVTPELNLQGELNFATEAYDDFDSDIQLRVGADYEIKPDLLLRGGTSIGLDDGAPDLELSLRCLLLF